MKQKSLTGFMHEVIEELCCQERFATAHIYRYTLRAFTEFVGGGVIYFGGISRRSLRNFQTYLEDRQRSYNTISTYLRVLRAVYNRAVDCELIRGEFRLFSGLKTGVASERKLAVTATQMQRLLKLPASPEASGGSPKMKEACDSLSLMMLLQGMPYIDLAHLHKRDLSGDLLTCRRRKTGTELCVRVTSEAMRLMDRYRSTDERSPYLLTLLSGTKTGEDAFYEYQGKLRELNRSLSFLPSLCGLKNLKVSSYTARHTWATLAKYCQVPEEVISEGLGHSSLEVTRTYLKSFEGGELAKANRIIIDYIYSGKKTEWGKAR